MTQECEVHHVVPQKDGGSDTIDNAAPLCPSCHDRFGGNPDKRKEIRQMRDWWYEIVSEKFSGDSVALRKAEEINNMLLAMQTANGEAMASLKREFEEQITSTKNELLGQMRRTTEPKKFQEVANAYITATRLGNGVHANVSCKKCGTKIGLLIGSNNCPTCKTPI